MQSLNEAHIRHAESAIAAAFRDRLSKDDHSLVIAVGDYNGPLHPPYKDSEVDLGDGIVMRRNAPRQSTQYRKRLPVDGVILLSTKRSGACRLGSQGDCKPCSVGLEGVVGLTLLPEMFD